ncbi:hypothetical protein PR202_gb06917 [Eleusine coracana subsp. coracana]|uniref:Uncharacterized protein n=1 Tax=Eleusine coracana subsp. coracana TaxID=191504 RepID=A0AAV5EA16_ELECO|nr:hypothetical protein PR202_gb06917 [Eleusine coracana subsp. coracana]
MSVSMSRKSGSSSGGDTNSTPSGSLRSCSAFTVPGCTTLGVRGVLGVALRVAPRAPGESLRAAPGSPDAARGVAAGTVGGDVLLVFAPPGPQRKLVHQKEPDFIEVLLSHQHEYGLTRDHLKALLIDIVFGGTDTSYLVLEFVMAELVRNPQAMSKLQDEVRHSVHKGQEMVTEDDLTGMNYLKVVIKETLRLHPPAPLLAPHHSMTDVHIDGYTVPANIPILINAWTLGRDATVWEDAEDFKPERFMDTGNDADINFKGNDFQFIPFGAGRRICPGMNFAISTLEIMLANLVYRFNWEVPAAMEKASVDMTEVFWLTVHRKEKLHLVPQMFCV